MPMVDIKIGNLLRETLEAIVNPAHSSLLAGSGLCGQIHRAAGPQLERLARLLGPLEFGQALLTPGYRLPQPWVVHAAPPKWQRETSQEWLLLLETFAAAVHCAGEHGLTSLAFPAMGIGVNRFPQELAASAAAQGIRLALRHYPALQVRLVVATDDIHRTYIQAFQQEGLLGTT